MRWRIPKEVKISSKTYTVVRGVLPKATAGEVNYRKKLVVINKELDAEDAWFYFWHEVIHTILRDMRRHDLNTEPFVNAFQRRLCSVLRQMKG